MSGGGGYVAYLAIPDRVYYCCPLGDRPDWQSGEQQRQNRYEESDKNGLCPGRNIGRGSGVYGVAFGNELGGLKCLSGK